MQTLGSPDPEVHFPAEATDEGSTGGEDVDAVVGAVGDHDLVAGRDGDIEVEPHLAGCAPCHPRFTCGRADIGIAEPAVHPLAESADECTSDGEDVDALVAVVGNVDRPRGVGRDPPRFGHVAGHRKPISALTHHRADIAAPRVHFLAEGAKESTLRGEDIDPIVLTIGDEDVAFRADRHSPRLIHPPGRVVVQTYLAAGSGCADTASARIHVLAKGTEECAIGREDVNAEVA